MNLHANAKTSPKTRLLLVERVLKHGWDLGSAAEAVGLSKRSGAKWLARYRAEGLAGLQDRSSAPHCVANRTSDRITRRIDQLRRQRLPAFQIARILDMARSTVSAVLKRLGLNKLRVLEPKEPANRYEHARPQQPGVIVDVDFGRGAVGADLEER